MEEELIECTICTNIYESNLPQDTPHLLSCAHTFCFGCLTKIFDTKNKSIVCPLCERVSHFKDIAEIPKNLRVLGKLNHTVRAKHIDDYLKY